MSKVNNKSNSTKKKWYKDYALVTIICSAVIVIFNQFGNIVDDLIKGRIEARKLDLQIHQFKVNKNIHESKLYKQDFTIVNSLTKLLSDLQFTITTEIKVCKGKSVLNYYNTETKFITLSKLQAKRLKLRKRVIKQFAILHKFGASNVHAMAIAFLDLDKSYPDPCVKTIPSENIWINSEGSVINALVDRLNSKYPAFTADKQL